MLLRLTESPDVFNPVVGDLHIEDGQLQLIGKGDSLVEAVATDIRSACQMFKGEWFVDLDEGVPYFEQIFVKAPNLNAIKAIYRQIILTRNHVSSLPTLDLSLDKATREASLTFVAVLTTGDTVDSTKFAPFKVVF